MLSVYQWFHQLWPCLHFPHCKSACVRHSDFMRASNIFITSIGAPSSLCALCISALSSLHAWFLNITIFHKCTSCSHLLQNCFLKIMIFCVSANTTSASDWDMEMVESQPNCLMHSDSRNFENWSQIFHWPTSSGASERVSGASERASGWASGPVLTSWSKDVLNHCAGHDQTLLHEVIQIYV